MAELVAAPRPTRVFDWRLLGGACAVAALYALAGRIGLSFAQTQENATLIWAPTGLALATLVLFGRRLWPGVLAGALLVNLLVGTEMVPSLFIGVGNTLEAVVGSLLLERVARFDPRLARTSDVVGLVVWGVLGCTLISATVGVATLSMTGAVTADTAGLVWRDWWLGDAGGALVVAPVLFVALRGSPPWGDLARRIETWIVVAALCTSGVFAFGGLLESVSSRLLAAFLTFPFLVWAGLRLGPRGAVVASFVAACFAVLGTTNGTGPFIGKSSVLLLWAYLVAVGAAATFLAAAIAERDEAEASRRRTEQNRSELEEQLHHSQRLDSLGLLAGGVAHDFNNLLGVVRGNADLVRDDTTAEGQQLLEEIDRAVVRASELCSQMLTYAGRNPAEPTRVDLGSLAQELSELLASSVPGNVDLVVDLVAERGDRGDRAEGPSVLADATQIRQILMNLILNAVEAIGDRSGRVRISSGEMLCDAEYLTRSFLHSDAEPGRFVYVDVEDDGCGMDEATLQRIFDPFFSTKPQGRGLGMSAVAGIVRSNRGAVKVKSELGRGSRFRLLLPPWSGSDDAPSIEPEVRLATAHTMGVGATVLVADDEEGILHMAERALRRAGYHVQVARDGREAVEVFEAHGDEIDAVLLDLSMPRATGIQALRQMRRRRPGLPAVLMSGFTEEMIEPGASRFLHKPFDSASLLGALADSLEKTGSV